MSLAETTVVTAFYPLKKSKHSIGKFRAWIQNFCKIPAHLVIFTTETYMLEIYQWRKEYMDRTSVIVRAFDSFAMTCPAMMRFWEAQWALDPEKDAHSPELYAVWAMKQELVRIVLNNNRFQSKWFVWCDIGIQRYSSLQGFYSDFPSDVPRLCEAGRLTFLEIAKIPETYVNDWNEGKPMEYPMPAVALGGGCIAGDAAAWLEFGEAYKEMLKEFALRQWFAGKDSAVFFAILMEKRTKPFRLFHAKEFALGGGQAIKGIEWMSLPAMLGGALDAALDMRFEPVYGEDQK
jgi:hypothetical protein